MARKNVPRRGDIQVQSPLSRENPWTGEGWDFLPEKSVFRGVPRMKKGGVFTGYSHPRYLWPKQCSSLLLYLKYSSQALFLRKILLPKGGVDQLTYSTSSRVPPTASLYHRSRLLLHCRSCLLLPLSILSTASLFPYCLDRNGSAWSGCAGGFFHQTIFLNCLIPTASTERGGGVGFFFFVFFIQTAVLMMRESGGGDHQ